MRTSSAIVPALFAAAGLAAPAGETLEARQWPQWPQQPQGAFPGYPGFPGAQPGQQPGQQGLAPDSAICGWGFNARVYEKAHVDQLVATVCKFPATGMPGFPSYHPNVEGHVWEAALPEHLFFKFPIEDRPQFPSPYGYPGQFPGQSFPGYPGFPSQPQQPQTQGDQAPPQPGAPVAPGAPGAPGAPTPGAPQTSLFPQETKDYVVYSQDCTAMGVITEVPNQFNPWGGVFHAKCEGPQGAGAAPAPAVEDD